MPVTLEAAENDPIRSGRSAVATSASSSAARSTWPSASSGIVITSAIVSRHGSSFEWCSYGTDEDDRALGGGMCEDSP
jgi:hypothetical protein